MSTDRARSAVTCVLALLSSTMLCAGEPAGGKIKAWNKTQRGANYIVYEEGVDPDLRAAREYGMTVLRVFMGPRTAENTQDFFWSEAFEKDLERMERFIDLAHAAEMKIVLSGGRVPGRQYLWVQDQRADRRLWRSFEWHERFANYWTRIARRFAKHPAVNGYDILNEPRPEQTAARPRWDKASLKAFYSEVAGTPRDLNLLYARTVEAIRKVDAETPIILSPGLWGSPMAFIGLEPSEDENTLYTFHWYSPGAYTVWRSHRGKWSYPGEIPEDGYEEETPPMVMWNINTHRQRMAKPVREWQKRNGVPSNRVFMGEFSADRRLQGADQYNRDVIAVAEENDWHWAYYAFREREWNSRDFELGSKRGATKRSLTPMMQTIIVPMNKD